MFRRGLLRIVIGLIIYNCGGAQPTSLSNHRQTGVPPGKGTRELTKRERLLAEAELAWAKRDEYEQVENAIEYWHRALSLDSRDIATWNRISRARLFLVDLLCVHPRIRATANENNTDSQNAPGASVSVQVSNKSAANSPEKPSAPEGPARTVLAIPEEPARGRKPVLQDDVDAAVTIHRYPPERLRASESSPSTRIPVEHEEKRKPSNTNLNECRSLTTEAAENLRQREQIDLLQKGKQAAEKALALHAPGIPKELEENVVSIESLTTVKTNAVPALYWRSMTTDELSRIKGYTERVIQKDPLTISMAYCMEKKPHYDYGGPHRYFGTFYARPLSLADKDLKKSQTHFKRAIAIAPGYFANRYAYARDYAIMAQDRKTFETQLKTILEANIESDSSIAPENRIYRRKAEILLRQASEYFE